MVTVSVGNSYSKVTGLDKAQFAKLRQALSYQSDSQAAFFAGGFQRTRYMIDNKGVFPTGLLHRVQVNIPEHAFVDSRVKPIRRPVMLKKPLVPYREQEFAEAAAVHYGRGIISMPTGTGKSYVIALIIAQYGLRTLVVVPSLEIKKQLTASLREALGPLSNVVVENIDSKALETATGFDVLIVDEAHHVAAKTYQQLNKKAWTGIYYRFFLTATPFRNDTEETLLFEGIAGCVIYRLPYDVAVKNKLIVPVEAYYIDLPKQETDAFTWAQVYSELIVNNEVRNDIIALIAGRLNRSGTSTLVLVKEVAHCTALAAISGLHHAHGQDEYSRIDISLFNDGSLKTLIATEGLMGEGVDTKPCEVVIIAGLGKAKSAFMQKVGRAVRSYPGKESAKIILFRDRSHKFLLRHFREQCAILKSEYGITPTKLEL